MAASIEKLVKTYVKMRDKRAELSDTFKAADSKLIAKMDLIKQALLQHCKDHDVTSVKTSEGSFFRTTKQRYWTSDWESMHEFIMENNLPHFFEKRLNQTNVKQFLEENPDLVPKGLNVDSEYVVSVRKK